MSATTTHTNWAGFKRVHSYIQGLLRYTSSEPQLPAHPLNAYNYATCIVVPCHAIPAVAYYIYSSTVKAYPCSCYPYYTVGYTTLSYYIPMTGWQWHAIMLLNIIWSVSTACICIPVPLGRGKTLGKYTVMPIACTWINPITSIFRVRLHIHSIIDIKVLSHALSVLVELISLTSDFTLAVTFVSFGNSHPVLYI